VPEPSSLAFFAGASAALLVVPGPAVLFIVARSVEQGTRAGLVSTLGISFGTLAHVTAAALGLSALLASSAVAFEALKYVGAAYLIYLGVQTLRRPPAIPRRAAARARSDRHLFWQAALVNLLNPKTALFFFAFLPQFVDPGSADSGVQIVLLGSLYIAMALVNDAGYALFAGELAEWLQRSPTARTLQRWTSGTTLLGLGVAAATSSND